jgi:hypothetical protein
LAGEKRNLSRNVDLRFRGFYEGEMMIPQTLFGRIDLIVAAVVAAGLFIAFLIEIPDIARYLKIKSM